MSTTTTPRRYVDPHRALWTFAHRSLVVCPSCGRCAVATSPAEGWVPGTRGAAAAHTRVTCPHCAFIDGPEDGTRGLLATHWYGPTVALQAHRRCPLCGMRMKHATHSAAAGQPRPTRARVVCPSGAHEVEVELTWFFASPAEPHDPTFGLPLWLQVPCCGDALWAYDAAHVAELRAYVAADLQERDLNGTHTMAARLPTWIADAQNRTAVLRGLDRLDARLLEAGVA